MQSARACVLFGLHIFESGATAILSSADPSPALRCYHLALGTAASTLEPIKSCSPSCAPAPASECPILLATLPLSLPTCTIVIGAPTVMAFRGTSATQTLTCLHSPAKLAINAAALPSGAVYAVPSTAGAPPPAKGTAPRSGKWAATTGPSGCRSCGQVAAAAATAAVRPEAGMSSPKAVQSAQSGGS